MTADSYRLDTAGRLWPLVRSGRLTSLFRISVELEASVQLPALQAAIADVRTTFSGLFVRLRRGVFWSYLAADKERDICEPEAPSPCMERRRAGERMTLLRVVPYRNRISVECSHALTDGTGAATFLSALIDRYVERITGDPPSVETSAAYNSPVDWENAFARHARRDLPTPIQPGVAFHPRTTLLPHGTYRVITGEIATADLKVLASAQDLRIGEFLVMVLAEAGQRLAIEQGAADRSVRILVPVDLRRQFPSITLRNFFGFVAPELDLRFGTLASDEIADEVRWQMRLGLAARRLQAQFSAHVRSETHPFLRVLPEPVKRAMMLPVFPAVAESRFTASLSNLGVFPVSRASAGRIRRVVFVPPPSPWTRTNCSVVSHGGSTAISFGSTATERDLEREFFRVLRRKGGTVRVGGVYQ